VKGKATRKGGPEKASTDSSHLNAKEQEQAEAHASPRAVVIHEIIREDGELELTRTVSALVLSGLAAGLSMGFSFLTQALLHASLPDAPWRHVLDSFGYSIGFVFVVLGRQQLFTESTLTAVLPVLMHFDWKTVFLMARLWVIVLIVNLAGTWIFACMLEVKPAFTPDVNRAMEALAQQALGISFGVTFLKSILAGWLIALMVWILPSAQSARLLTVLLITWVVALAQLSHVVAGSAEAAYAVLSGFSTLGGGYFLEFLLPTLLGNVLGGVALVSLLNHGSVVEEIQGE
jgi:formate/nitrite transporter FocA (FNT family)